MRRPGAVSLVKPVQGIYAIYCTASMHEGRQHCYVGSSVNIANRWSEHLQMLITGTHHSSRFQRAWDKYVITMFMFQVLEVVESRSDLIEREQHYIDTMLSSFNMSKIADRPSRIVVKSPLPGGSIAKRIQERELKNKNDRLVEEQVRRKMTENTDGE